MDKLLVVILLLFSINHSFGREYTSEPSDGLGPGDWLVTDRVKNTPRWNSANQHNLANPQSGKLQYQTLGERAAFYRWFQGYAEGQGHEVKWPGAAADVVTLVDIYSNLLTKNLAVDITFAQDPFIKTDQELLGFANKDNTNKAIFDHVFDSMHELSTRSTPLTGQMALEWDAQRTVEEQTIAQGFIDPLSDGAVERLQNDLGQKTFPLYFWADQWLSPLCSGGYSLPG